MVHSGIKKWGQGFCSYPIIYPLLFTVLRWNVFLVFHKYIDKEANIWQENSYLLLASILNSAKL